MVIEASIPTRTTTLRRVLVWVTAAAALADIVLLGIAAKRYWQLVPAAVFEIAKPMDPRFASAAKLDARELAEKIRAEIAASGAEVSWPGEYYEGDGLCENVNLSLAPKSGFVFGRSGCLGLYDRNFGTVADDGDHLELLFRFPNVHAANRGLPAEFIPVRWGDRRYLLAPEQIERFCADANSGDEPRPSLYGEYLMRRGDEHGSVSGVPIVPAQYSKLLFNPPLEARVVEVLESWKHDTTVFLTRVRIDAGSEKGVVSGMSMWLVEPSEIRSLAVVDVSEQSSIAIVKRSEASAALPAIGWKFSTRVWNR